MSIEKSFKGVSEFYKQNQDLIQTLVGTAKDATDEIVRVAQQLDDLRKKSSDLVDALNVSSFDVAKTESNRLLQQTLLSKIDSAQKKIETFIDDPVVTTPIFGDLVGYYLELANTYNDNVRKIVQFSNKEIIELNTLIQKATLDTISRQRWADVLAGAVALTKLALKVAVKLAI